MGRYLLPLAILMALASGISMADDTADRMAAARELMKAGKHSEALAAFTSLAATSRDDTLKSEAYELAAYSALRQRHQDPTMIPLAMELARQIPLKGPSVKCRMVVLAETGQNGELIKQFANLDVSDMPADIAPQVLFMRGRAFAMLRKGKEAEADFKMALERRPTDKAYLMALAGNYDANLKDSQKAVEIYQQIIRSVDKPHHAVDAVVSLTRILINRAAYAEALKTLEPFSDDSALSNYQRVLVLRAFGQVYAGLGREEEALASFNRANQAAGTQ